MLTLQFTIQGKNERLIDSCHIVSDTVFPPLLGDNRTALLFSCGTREGRGEMTWKMCFQC